MIKVINHRENINHSGLFHYKHFICDCLFPEIINNIFLYKEVIREKNILQTIGNFSTIYKDVMNIKHTELITKDFDNLKTDIISYHPKEKYCNQKYFNIFRKFIFSRYNIQYNNTFPKIILIKKYTTGKEIKDIHKLELYMKNKYNTQFKSLYFEFLPFQQQIQYFYNANIIVSDQCDVMSNMFFCKKNTTIIQIIYDTYWKFFDIISNILELKHIKCHNNEFNDIIKLI